MLDRRRLLRAVGAATVTAIAGCSDRSTSGASVGTTQEMSGLAFTVTAVEERSYLDVVPEGEAAPTTSAPTTRLTPGTNELRNPRRFLVVVLRIENVSDASQPLPAPAIASGTPPPRAGGSIAISGTHRVFGEIPAMSVAGDLLRNGSREEGLERKLARLDWTLAPGESVAGWLVFRVDESFDRTKNSLAVEIEGSNIRWRLAD